MLIHVLTNAQNAWTLYVVNSGLGLCSCAAEGSGIFDLNLNFTQAKINIQQWIQLAAFPCDSSLLF